MTARSTRGLRIRTKCETTEALVAWFHRFCEDTSIFIATKEPREAGLDTAFSIDLASGEPALAGEGVVLAAYTSKDNRFKAPGMHIRIRSLTRGSERVFERMLIARAVEQDRTPLPPNQSWDEGTEVDSAVPPIDDTIMPPAVGKHTLLGFPAMAIPGLPPAKPALAALSPITPLRPPAAKPAEPAKRPSQPRIGGAHAFSVPAKIEPPSAIKRAGGVAAKGAAGAPLIIVPLQPRAAGEAKPVVPAAKPPVKPAPGQPIVIATLQPNAVPIVPAQAQPKRPIRPVVVEPLSSKATNGSAAAPANAPSTIAARVNGSAAAPVVEIKPRAQQAIDETKPFVMDPNSPRPESIGVAKPHSIVEAKPEAKPAAVVDAKADDKPQAKPVVESKPQIEPKPQPQPAAASDAKPRPIVDSKSQPKPAPTLHASTDAKSSSVDADAKPAVMMLDGNTERSPAPIFDAAALAAFDAAKQAKSTASIERLPLPSRPSEIDIPVETRGNNHIGRKTPPAGSAVPTTVGSEQSARVPRAATELGSGPVPRSPARAAFAVTYDADLSTDVLDGDDSAHSPDDENRTGVRTPTDNPPGPAAPEEQHTEERLGAFPLTTAAAIEEQFAAAVTNPLAVPLPGEEFGASVATDPLGAALDQLSASPARIGAAAAMPPAATAQAPEVIANVARARRETLEPNALPPPPDSPTAAAAEAPAEASTNKQRRSRRRRRVAIALAAVAMLCGAGVGVYMYLDAMSDETSSASAPVAYVAPTPPATPEVVEPFVADPALGKPSIAEPVGPTTDPTAAIADPAAPAEPTLQTDAVSAADPAATPPEPAVAENDPANPNAANNASPNGVKRTVKRVVVKPPPVRIRRKPKPACSGLDCI